MESKGKILLVEDDKNFGDVLRSYLEMNDYDVTLEEVCEAGLTRLKQYSFYLCIFYVLIP